jgi:hypothetical protein
MRRSLPAVVGAVLVLAAATPAAAGAPLFAPSAVYNAYAIYQSDATLLGPGVHTRMAIRYSRYEDSQVIQIEGIGWDNGTEGGAMLSDWAWAYEMVYPSTPVVGGVTRSLNNAWATSGTLTFQCWTPGKCPVLPAQIVLTAHWTATGPITADQWRDTTGDPTTVAVSRSRPATVNLDLTYPARDGPLPFPALMTRTLISWQHFAHVNQ